MDKVLNQEESMRWYDSLAAARGPAVRRSVQETVLDSQQQHRALQEAKNCELRTDLRFD